MSAALPDIHDSYLSPPDRCRECRAIGLRGQVRILLLEERLHRLEGQLGLLGRPTERRHRRRAAVRLFWHLLMLRLQRVRPPEAKP